MKKKTAAAKAKKGMGKKTALPITKPSGKGRSQMDSELIRDAHMRN